MACAAACVGSVVRCRCGPRSATPLAVSPRALLLLNAQVLASFRKHAGRRNAFDDGSDDEDNENSLDADGDEELEPEPESKEV